jgi:hypothetical protein
MSTLTCAEVEGQLDLLAAGECDQLTQQRLERHLEHCAACAARHAQSQRLIGLLDLHAPKAGLRRLRQRIEEEERRRHRSRVLPFVRRFASVAALVLVTLLVSRPWPLGEPGLDSPVVQLAVRDVPPRGAENVPGTKEMMGVVRAQAPAGELRGDAARQELTRLQRAGRLPPPTEAPLVLELKNTGGQPVKVRLGDETTRLVLDVRGKGVVRLPAPGAAEPEVFRPQTFWLAPGARQVFHMDRLIAGRPGQPEYLYLTEPGVYPLTARWRLTLAGRVTTLTGKPTSIVVP